MYTLSFIRQIGPSYKLMLAPPLLVLVLAIVLVLVLVLVLVVLDLLTVLVLVLTDGAKARPTWALAPLAGA